MHRYGRPTPSAAQLVLTRRKSSETGTWVPMSAVPRGALPVVFRCNKPQISWSIKETLACSQISSDATFPTLEPLWISPYFTTGAGFHISNFSGISWSRMILTLWVCSFFDVPKFQVLDHGIPWHTHPSRSSAKSSTQGSRFSRALPRAKFKGTYACGRDKS